MLKNEKREIIIKKKLKYFTLNNDINLNRTNSLAPPTFNTVRISCHGEFTIQNSLKITEPSIIEQKKEPTQKKEIKLINNKNQNTVSKLITL